MKSYPSIPTSKENKTTFEPNTIFYITEKIDGSNIRVEWTKKAGFAKFGSRKRLLGTDQGLLYKSVELAKQYEDIMHDIFSKQIKTNKATCFFEFHGANSFAGNHAESDTFQLTLLDVTLEKVGFLSPKDFYNTFSSSGILLPALLDKTTLTSSLISQVEDGTYPGMSFEGVVCKAPATKKWQQPLLIKIKNKAWIEKVKSQYDEKMWDYLL